MTETEVVAVIIEGDGEVEIILEEIEFHHKSDRAKHLHVLVVNENDGTEFLLRAMRHTPISKLITKIYHKVGRERLPDDRLRCACGGQDVFEFASLDLGQYLAAGHCPELEWRFVSGTGGA
jgi:hypothetical protein